MAETPPQTTAPQPKSGENPVGKVLRLLFSPLLFLVRPLVFHVSHDPHNPKVSFTSYSALIYLWPIMVIGWLNSLLLRWNWAGPELLGWVWITVVLLVFICIGTDVNRNKAIVIVLLILLGWTSGALLSDRAQIPVLSHLYNYFAGLGVQFEPGTAKFLGIAILLLLVGTVFIAWFDGRYEITTREITHTRVLRASDSFPRGAKRVKLDWRDLAEVLLGFGAGDVLVIDAQRNELLRIPNVPFLWFFRRDIERVLEVLATTHLDDQIAAEG